MTIVTMALEALGFLAVTMSVLTVVGVGPMVLLGPSEQGLELLLSPVVGLATLYLACQWLTPVLPSSLVVTGTVAAGGLVSALAVWRCRAFLIGALARLVPDVTVTGAVSVVTYLALLVHLFRLRLFTLAGTGFDALFIYAPVAEFMRRHPYMVGRTPALDVPALPTLQANFYPGSLGTFDGGLSFLTRRSAFALIEPVNAVCVVLALLGVYVLVASGLGFSRRTAAVATVVMVTNQFLFWAAGFDFVQQFRASALLPTALALLLLALRTGRGRLAFLAGGVAAASAAVYMPVFLVVLAAGSSAVAAALVAGAATRSWDSLPRALTGLAAGGIGLGLPSVHWLIFGGGLHAWDLVSRNLFSPYPAGGMLDIPYGLPYLTGSASVAYLYRVRPGLFWGPAWAFPAHLAAYLAVALGLAGLAALLRRRRWPEAALFGGSLVYLAYVRLGAGNLYGFVKTTSYLVPLTSSLIAVGASRLGHQSTKGSRGRLDGRLPAAVVAAPLAVVVAVQLAATVETDHLFLQLPPTISRQQVALRALPGLMTGKGAVLIEDFSPFIPGTPLTVNSALDHMAAYFITDRDVTIVQQPAPPDLLARSRFLVRIGARGNSPSGYRMLWRHDELDLSLYDRG